MESRVTKDKHFARKTWNEVYPNIFTIRYGRCGQVLWVDGMLLIRSYFNMNTYQEVLDRTKNFIDTHLRHGHKYVIISFDRPEFVPNAKQQEHKKRDKNTLALVEGVDYPSKITNNDMFVQDRPLDVLLSARSNYRTLFIRWLSYELLFGDDRPLLEPGRRFGIYGHRMTIEYMNERHTDNIQVENEFPEDFCDRLLILRSDYNLPDYITMEYKSQHGEADEQGFYLAACLMKEDSSIKIVEFMSTDTDFMYYCWYWYTNYRQELGLEDVYYSFASSNFSTNPFIDKNN